MIQVDISNIWGQLSLPDLLAIEARTAESHRLLLEEGYPEEAGEFLGWGFENPVWLYAAVQNLMEGIGKSREVLVLTQPGTAAAGALWQGLFGGTVATDFSGGDGFETTVRFGGPDGDFLEALQRHADLGFPVVCIDCGPLGPKTLRELELFFRCARALSDRLREG